MRLIDADALIEDLKKWKGLNNNTIEAAVDTTNNQPTVYDVEKVVAEIRKSSGIGYRDVDGDYVPPMIETEEAIDIVKKGGI